jgi:hypothetical protein
MAAGYGPNGGCGERGYVLNAGGRTWLYEYVPRSICPNWYEGEATSLDGGRFLHPPVSVDLKAKLAVWAYTVVVQAREKSDPVAREDALKRADVMGRYLTVLLRGEIGPGPVLLYVDQWRDPCGGAHEWQIADDGTLLPYWHRRQAGYVIDCEEMGEWAFHYYPAHKWLLSSGVAGEGHLWYGERSLPKSLIESFCRWHGRWRQGCDGWPNCVGDWQALNEEGLDLARELKEIVGTEYRVIYVRFFEEPQEQKPWKAAEVLRGGVIRPYVHEPYWLRGLSISGR